MIDAVCTATTIRATLADTLAFVHYHLNTGVDRMYLYFDDPEDAAVDRLKGYPRLTCVRCDQEYWRSQDLPPREQLHSFQFQGCNSSHALALARRAGTDWIIHLDSDELLLTATPLGKALGQVRSDIDFVRFPTFEAVPDRLFYDCPLAQVSDFKTSFPDLLFDEFDHPRAGVRLGFSRFSYLTRRKLARWGATPRLFRHGFLKGHSTGKSAVRTVAHVSRLGAHVPTGEPGSRLRFTILPAMALLHFDACGLEAWRTRWVRSLKGQYRSVSRRPERTDQLTEFAAAYRSGDEERLEELYRITYFLTTRDRIVLRLLGLFRTISIPPCMFEPPADCAP